ncbi:MAG TPA: hypothetical protein VGQ39_06950 [Pyrinomonadaceae bacterium]|nr:hypothetical protein [Pyrinomonadaceae bacterium]
MKTLGLIGGIGPESTIDYYRMLSARYRERANGEYPSVIINSKVRASGLNTVALLGTRFTMQATFYQNVFERAGIN